VAVSAKHERSRVQGRERRSAYAGSDIRIVFHSSRELRRQGEPPGQGQSIVAECDVNSNCPMTAQRFSVDPSEFATKRVLVTGGTKSMGQAIVQRLTAGGATVATTARSPLPDRAASGSNPRGGYSHPQK
jgi:3-oxoacyl-ACP reductase-like protein